MFKRAAAISTILLLAAVLPCKTMGQCTTGAYWLNGTVPANGSLRDTAILDFFDTVQVVTSNPTSGSFQTSPTARPAYWYAPTVQWGGVDYTSVQIIRGGGHGAKTYFKLQYPKDSSIVHVKVSNVRGDGIFCSNCEHQKITGYLNGVKVNSTFKALLNGAIVSGDNLDGGTGTTGAIQSEGRIFFNSDVDSIVVTSISNDDYIIADLFARCYALLPVRWMDFEGTILQNTIRLNWSTAAEYGNREFIVEKMINGSWTNLGVIAGAGASNVTRDYQFIDNFPLTGNNIYHIKQINADGSFSYSRTITLLFSKPSFISVYPNPASDLIHIESGNAIKNIELLLSDGKIARTYAAANVLQYNIQTNGLAKGIYMLKLVLENNSTTFRKIIIR